MKQGCLCVNADLIIQPDIFDAVADLFKIVRSIEVVETKEIILIVEHDSFMEVNEGEWLPFYDIEIVRKDDEYILRIYSLYVHTKYSIKCQSQKETPKNPEAETPLIWVP